MFTQAFLLDTGERALKTFIQALAATLAIAVPTGLASWEQAIAAAAGAAVLSVVTSITSNLATKSGTASLVKRAPEAK